MALDDETRAAFIEAARRAPSADNSQPWTYCWEGDQLDLRIDPSRAGGASDQRYVLSDLALGACVENVVVQARALGHRESVDVFPDPSADPLWVARIRFERAGRCDEDLAAAIPKRRTNRSFPWGAKHWAAGTRAMAAAAEQLPGAKLLWLTRGREYRVALKALRLAEGLRFRSRSLHAELFGSVRFDLGRKGVGEEGLGPATLGIGALEWPGFSLLRSWSAMKIVRWLGADRMLALRSAVLPVTRSGGLGILCISDTDRPSVLRAGRALERAWLAATASNLAVQPHAAPGVLGLGLIDIEPAHRRRLAMVQDALQHLGCEGYPLMFLRVGDEPTTPGPRSGRRPLSDFEATRSPG